MQIKAPESSIVIVLILPLRIFFLHLTFKELWIHNVTDANSNPTIF